MLALRNYQIGKFDDRSGTERPRTSMPESVQMTRNLWRFPMCTGSQQSHCISSGEWMEVRAFCVSGTQARATTSDRVRFVASRTSYICMLASHHSRKRSESHRFDRPDVLPSVPRTFREQQVRVGLPRWTRDRYRSQLLRVPCRSRAPGRPPDCAFDCPVSCAQLSNLVWSCGEECCLTSPGRLHGPV
ncbi:hypothetical protein BD414DRAFT_170960 [Trametes punicea]|nr:hypothetical protein BD414DRAFT_170960 [Trametes punicea]